MTRNQKIILAVILLVSAVLIFFRLARHDMLGDDAHYALRSIGYFDYVASFEQTTPVHWFGEIRPWAFFSFHDHPLLFFLIQFISFKIFGISVVASRLPSAFAAIGAILVLFFWGKKISGTRAGLLAAGALAVNNYFVWTGRVGLLESVFTFFLLLGFLYLTKSLEESPKYFKLTGFFFGLALLTKYTLFFVLPAVLVYLIWQKRSVFRHPDFWKGVFIFCAMSIPILIYNLGMYESRGHFDVQLADLFGQSNADWKIISNRVSGFHFAIADVIKILISGFSWPYFAVFALSFFGTIYIGWKQKKYILFLPIFVLVSFTGFFTLVGATSRWLGVMAPFAALTLGIALDRFYASPYFKSPVKYILISLGFALVLFSIFYSLNTNSFRKPLGNKKMYADFRIENYGYNQLDKEIRNLLGDAKPTDIMKEATRTWWYPYMQPQTIQFSSINKGHREFNNLIIYDSNTNWFPDLWTFEKWKLYRRFTIMTSEEFLKVVRSDDLEKMDTLGFEGVYFIKAGPKVMETAGLTFPEIDQLYDDIKRTNTEPKIIHDDLGREAFYIYNVKFEGIRVE